MGARLEPRQYSHSPTYAAATEEETMRPDRCFNARNPDGDPTLSTAWPLPLDICDISISCLDAYALHSNEADASLDPFPSVDQAVSDPEPTDTCDRCGNVYPRSTGHCVVCCTAHCTAHAFSESVEALCCVSSSSIMEKAGGCDHLDDDVAKEYKRSTRRENKWRYKQKKAKRKSRELELGHRKRHRRNHVSASPDVNYGEESQAARLGDSMEGAFYVGDHAFESNTSASNSVEDPRSFDHASSSCHIAADFGHDMSVERYIDMTEEYDALRTYYNTMEGRSGGFEFESENTFVENEDTKMDHQDGFVQPVDNALGQVHPSGVLSVHTKNDYNMEDCSRIGSIPVPMRSQLKGSFTKWVPAASLIYLPRELRDMIYSYLWADTCLVFLHYLCVVEAHTCADFCRNVQHGLPAWLLTCKRVLEEGAQSYGERAVFTADWTKHGECNVWPVERNCEGRQSSNAWPEVSQRPFHTMLPMEPRSNPLMMGVLRHVELSDILIHGHSNTTNNESGFLLALQYQNPRTDLTISLTWYNIPSLAPKAVFSSDALALLFTYSRRKIKKITIRVAFLPQIVRGEPTRSQTSAIQDAKNLADAILSPDRSHFTENLGAPYTRSSEGLTWTIHNLSVRRD